MRCPRDGAETVTTQGTGRGRFDLDVCPTCQGAWYDRGEITKASNDPEVERLILEYAGGASTLSCPRDGRAMARRPVGEASLDVCPRCKGVWMDAGEMEGITRGAVVSGQLWGSGRSLQAILNPPMKRQYPRDNL
jgi:Zn-finger nucleic acid-binding protein